MANPKVFISYSHDNPEHMKKVLELSDKMRLENIDCSIDQYEFSPSEGWAKWSEKHITNDDYIIMIINKTYSERSNDTEDIGKGKGVKWESTLIYNLVYHDDSKIEKIIPVIFNKNDKTYIPLFLKSATYINLGAENGYKKLYEYITKACPIQKPPLGQSKGLPEKTPKAAFIEDKNTGIQTLNLKTPTINLLNYASTTAGRTLWWNPETKIYSPTKHYGASGIAEYFETNSSRHPRGVCCTDPKCPYCHDYDCCSGFNCEICNHDADNCSEDDCEICNHIKCTFCEDADCQICKRNKKPFISYNY